MIQFPGINMFTGQVAVNASGLFSAHRAVPSRQVTDCDESRL